MIQDFDSSGLIDLAARNYRVIAHRSTPITLWRWTNRQRIEQPRETLQLKPRQRFNAFVRRPVGRPLKVDSVQAGSIAGDGPTADIGLRALRLRKR
jgi:hypothetical protein